MGNRTMIKAAGRWMAALVLAAAALGCGSGGGGGGGGADECAGFEDEAGTQITVRFTNNTPDVVYLGNVNGCGGLNPFSVRDSAGQDRPWFLDETCGFTCEFLQENGAGCPAICLIPPVYRIDPGGHYDLQWDGLLLEQRDMPAACFAEPQSVGTCQQQVLAPAGSYELTGTVYTGVNCEPMTGTCDCQASADGWCEVPTQGYASGNPLTATATAALPESGLVELVFQ